MSNCTCPGCGEDYGDRHSLADHLGDCDYPDEERFTFEIELRKLKDPHDIERHMEHPECGFAFISKGEFMPCRYGVRFKVGTGPDDCEVYYIKHSDLLWAFLDAVKKAGGQGDAVHPDPDPTQEEK